MVASGFTTEVVIMGCGGGGGGVRDRVRAAGRAAGVPDWVEVASDDWATGCGVLGVAILAASR